METLKNTESLLMDVVEFTGTLKMAKKIVKEFNSFTIEDQLEVGAQIEKELYNWERVMRNNGFMTNRNMKAISYINENLGK